VGGGERRAAAGKEGVAVDPVCGMEVETESARHTLDHEGFSPRKSTRTNVVRGGSFGALGGFGLARLGR